MLPPLLTASPPPPTDNIHIGLTTSNCAHPVLLGYSYCCNHSTSSSSLHLRTLLRVFMFSHGLQCVNHPLEVGIHPVKSLKLYDDIQVMAGKHITSQPLSQQAGLCSQLLVLCMTSMLQGEGGTSLVSADLTLGIIKHGSGSQSQSLGTEPSCNSCPPPQLQVTIVIKLNLICVRIIVGKDFKHL